MTLQDIYDQLAYGELRNLNLGSGTIAEMEAEGADGKMTEASFARLLPTIQLGLTELHKRFWLKEGYYTLVLEPGKVSYVIQPENEDLLKIERVYGIWEEQEYELPMNQLDNREAIRRTAFNTLLIPDDAEYAPWLNETSELKIVYRADHPKINAPIANSAPLITPIELPYTYLEPLLYYIASRMFNNTGLTGEAFHEGNNYMMKFENAVAVLEQQNFQLDTDDFSDAIERHGWV